METALVYGFPIKFKESTKNAIKTKYPHVSMICQPDHIIIYNPKHYIKLPNLQNIQRDMLFDTPYDESRELSNQFRNCINQYSNDGERNWLIVHHN